MIKVKAIISYDGSKFYGFQILNKGVVQTKTTVIGEIKKVLNFLGICSDIIGSGRTDRGVHAINQVVSFIVPDYFDNMQKLRYILNKNIKYIYFKKIEPVDDEFNPRFDAKKRVYRYIITNKRDVFLDDFVTFVNDKIDIKKIKEAIRFFEGKHNFVMFRKKGSNENTTIKTIFKTNFYKYKNFYVFYFEADSFLRSQIRLMVGFLLRISDGTYNNDDLKKQLNRKKLILTKPAPPNGLYLIRIKYS